MENRRGYRQTGFKSRLVQLASVLRTEQIRIGSGVCKYGFDLGTGANFHSRATLALQTQIRELCAFDYSRYAQLPLDRFPFIQSLGHLSLFSSYIRDKYFPKDSFSRSRRAAKCLSRVSRLTCVIRLRGKLRQSRIPSLFLSSFPDTDTFETISPLDNPPLNKGDFEGF